MPLEPDFRVDLAGETPLSRGGVIAVALVVALGIGGIAALHLFYRPEPPRLTSRLDEITQTVEDMKREQAELVGEQTALRKEMQAGFAQLRKAIEERRR